MSAVKQKTETEEKTEPQSVDEENKNQKEARRPRVISNPNDVAALVLAQLDNVSNKKDEFTIAVKGLADTTRQLVRAYGEHMKTIQELKKRVDQLEESK